MGGSFIEELGLYSETAGSGKAVLLISGLGGVASFWDRQVDTLAKHFRVVTHDHRGTGRSERSHIDHSIQQMASDVLALMDYLELESAHLVGHSTGGAIAQFLAVNSPRRVDKIVLSATWAGPDTYFRELFGIRKRILGQCGAEAYLRDGLLRVLPAPYLQANPDLIDRSIKERLEAFAGAEIELGRIDAILAHDLRDRFVEIKADTMVICAKDDQVTPYGLSRELARLIPKAKLHLLDGGGHFCPQIEADAYNEAVLEFLVTA